MIPLERANDVLAVAVQNVRVMRFDGVPNLKRLDLRGPLLKVEFLIDEGSASLSGFGITSRHVRVVRPPIYALHIGGGRHLAPVDRKSVVLGKSVSERVDLGGSRDIKKENKDTQKDQTDTQTNTKNNGKQ